MKKLLLLLFIPLVSCQDVEVRKTYYESGELRITVNYVDGLRQGQIKEYYKSGELSRTRTYVDGLRQGEEKEYYDSGELQYTSNYVDDLKQGEFKEYYESGELRSTVNYVDGLIQGEAKFYYESGKLEYARNYVDGLMEEVLIEDSKNKEFSSDIPLDERGEWKEYYESGKLKRTGNYVTSRKQGEWKEYYESGELKSTVDYNFGRASDIKAYNETGELIVFDRKKLIKTFHDNGQLKMEGVYADIDSLEFLLGKNIWDKIRYISAETGYYTKEGHITGIEAYRKVTEKPIKDDKWTYYYESGKIEKEEFYDVNFLNKVINYSEKGFKTSEIEYGLKEDAVLAEETKYYENGRTKSVYSEGYEGSYSAKYYENGQMEWEDWGDGTIKTYYENGTIKSEDYEDSYSAKYYENGQMEWEDLGEGEIKYYESVEPKTAKDTVNYVDGLRQGEAKFYYESGELASTGNYVDDLAQGEWKSFYKSGELRITGNYLDGLEQGEWKWYYKSGELEYTINYVDGIKQ